MQMKMEILGIISRVNWLHGTTILVAKMYSEYFDKKKRKKET
jgi:hypothetical protein